MTLAAGMQHHPPQMHDDSRSQPPASSQLTPTHQQPPPTKAAPARTFFDPWNSSSTGHQRAENRLSGSTSWRVSRNLKLSEQYNGGLGGGGKRVADTVGAGSEAFGKDGRQANGGWEKGAKGLRTGGQTSIAELWGASKSGKELPPAKVTERCNSPEEEAVSLDTDDVRSNDGGMIGLCLSHS
jgi:hypothetical protein